MKKYLLKTIAALSAAGMAMVPVSPCAAANIPVLDDVLSASAAADENSAISAESEDSDTNYDTEVTDTFQLESDEALEDEDTLDSGQTLTDEGDDTPEDGESIAVFYDLPAEDADSLDSGQTLTDEGDDAPEKSEAPVVQYEKETKKIQDTAASDSIQSGKIYPQSAFQIDYAHSKDAALAGTYRTTKNLYLRTGAEASMNAILIIHEGASVNAYGYYTDTNNVRWLLVQYILNQKTYTGFCDSRYLARF